MQKLCVRCKQRPALIYINKIEGQKVSMEGYCIKCAKELGIKPVSDYIKGLNLSEDDIEELENQMISMMPEGLLEGGDEGDESEDDGESRTPAFDLKRLFGLNSDNGTNLPAESKEPKASDKTEPARDQKDKKKKDRKMLSAYCLDLTGKAKDGKLDRIVGREKEIDRIVQIICRRTKNNPCLIGEPGVGKTAVAEALAQRIVDRSVPQKLWNKEIYVLDLTALVAGTQFRGQFESRVKGLVDEVKREGNIILVIDEIHTLVSAGNAEGGMNAENILKPALSRGEIQVIGATTLDEYREYIEKDQALERRFQPIMVNEPTIAETVEILKGVKGYYEQFHGVKIPEELLKRTVDLSERYITDRYLPDKAIDLIDEACAKLAVTSPIIDETERCASELRDSKEEKELLENESSPTNETYEKLANLNTKILRLEAQLSSLSAERDKVVLSEKNIADVIEAWTQIPASDISASEFDKIRHLKETLEKRIVGQDKAVDAVCRAVKRSRAGISYKKKPVSFIFAGPTGVGKTELVKSLADALFDSVDSLIRLDMSEFMEKHAVSRIIGSPPGYVGYDEAGQLTEKIRRKPYSVILFDEIEKAHPDVLNILLQILDDGRITDAHGKQVNFENTVIVMTTNAGTDIKSNMSGFTVTTHSDDEDKTKKGLNNFLRPEFLNRIDEIITFNRLTEDNFKDIARIRIKDLETALDEKGIKLTFDEGLFDHIAKKSFSEEFGARNLKRFIQTDIEDKIASCIIDGDIGKVSCVDIRTGCDSLEITAS